MTFISRTASFTGSIRLNGLAERVFQLFSPMGEKGWVPGWDPEIIHPSGGGWEEGLIFRTIEESGPAVWIVNRLNIASYNVRYNRIEPSHYVASIDVSCHEVSIGVTDISTVYSFVGLSEKGNDAISMMTAEEYAAKMVRWTSWLESCLAKGTIH